MFESTDRLQGKKFRAPLQPSTEKCVFNRRLFVLLRCAGTSRDGAHTCTAARMCTSNSRHRHYKKTYVVEVRACPNGSGRLFAIAVPEVALGFFLNSTLGTHTHRVLTNTACRFQQAPLCICLPQTLVCGCGCTVVSERIVFFTCLTATLTCAVICLLAPPPLSDEHNLAHHIVHDFLQACVLCGCG